MNQATPPLPANTDTHPMVAARRVSVHAQVLLPLLVGGVAIAFVTDSYLDHLAEASVEQVVHQRGEILADRIGDLLAEKNGSAGTEAVSAMLARQPDLVRWAVLRPDIDQPLVAGVTGSAELEVLKRGIEVIREVRSADGLMPLTMRLTFDHRYHRLPWEATLTTRSWLLYGTALALVSLAYLVVQVVMLRPLAEIGRLLRMRDTGQGGDIATHVPRGELRSLAKRLDETLDHLELMQRAVAASDHGLIICDARRDDQPIIYVNPAFLQLTGYTENEVLGRNCRFLQGQDRDQTGVERLRQGIRQGETCTALLRNYRKNGEVFWNQVQVSPIRNGKGELTHFIGIQIDMTAQETARRELIASEERYRHLTDVSPDAILIQFNEKFAYANPTAVRLLGAGSADQVVGRSVFDIVQTEFHDQVRQRIAQLITQGGSVPALDQRWRRVDGGSIEVEATATQVTVHGRQGILVVAHDVGPRKIAEQRLRQAHAEAELLLASLSAIYIGIDTNDRIRRWNVMAERTFGITAKDVIGRNLAESGLRVDWAEVFLAISRCMSEDRSCEIQELRFERPDGKEGFIHLHINRSNWAGDDHVEETLGVVLVGLDITQRRVMESLRNQGLKLESIGQLAAGIAHEINTPIQFVGDNLRFLSDAFADLRHVAAAQSRLLAAAATKVDLAEVVAAVQAAEAKADLGYLTEEVPKAVSQSLEGVERVANIVRAMKEFSHPDQGEEKRPADLNKALSTTLTVARNEYKYVADLVLDLAEDLPPIPCVIGEINQVFLNLLVNAAHAIGDVVKDSGKKGTITISTRRIADEWAEVRLGDTGTGIPEAIRERVFDPFFTTKGVGQGTGQGLYLSHAIITQKHQGTIRFETTPGVGTVFIIRLPLRFAAHGKVGET